MALKCESDKKWCSYCQRYTWFYRYPEEHLVNGSVNVALTHGTVEEVVDDRRD